MLLKLNVRIAINVVTLILNLLKPFPKLLK